MITNIAINGFGRIGRLVMRSLLADSKSTIKIVAINDLGDWKSNLHLLQYDSVHGNKDYEIQLQDDFVSIEGQEIRLFNEKDPKKLPLKDLNIDIMLECSGVFSTAKLAKQHLSAGAKKVLVSAPCTDADITTVFGINSDKITENHKIISNASCTTNCLAPIAQTLHENFGIISGFATTVHSFTNDQQLVDGNHLDYRRARSATCSIIPTTTGVAKNIAKVLPDLQGKINGTALRVPTPNVSLVDFTCALEKKVSKDIINNAFIQKSKGKLKGILDFTNIPLVSCDFNNNSHSSIVDLLETYTVGDNFCRVLAWYDNEWAFANRMIDITKVISGTF